MERSESMSNRAPLALSPALLAVRILLFLVFLPNGIQDLGMVEYTGVEADKVRRLLNPIPDQTEPADQTIQSAALHQTPSNSNEEGTVDSAPIKERALFKRAILIGQVHQQNTA